MKEQIEEMRDDISQIEKDVKNQCKDRKCKECHLFFADIDCYSHRMSEALYNAGYRKQSEGEWIDKPTGAYSRMQSWCSACRKHSGIGGIESNRHKPYCPNCGAHMKGENK